MNSKDTKVDSKLDIHFVIRDMLKEKNDFENHMNEGEALLDVKDSLNQRIISLRKQLVDMPDNQNLNLELAFLESEIHRIEFKIDEFNSNYDTNEGKIERYQQLIDYNIQDLYTYIEFLELLETDKLLTNVIKDSVKSIEENVNLLTNIKKKEYSPIIKLPKKEVD